MLTYRDIAKIFEEIELRLIRSLKRNLSRHKQEEKQEKFQWSVWQAEKLKNIEQFRRENRSIMDEYADVIDADTRELMQEQFAEGERLASSELGVRSSELSDDHFFGVDHNKMQHLMDDITTVEKNVETAALRTMDDVYRQTLNRVQLEMATGSLTINQAIDMAVKNFLEQGINCIVYKDGRHVNIADYVRMALRTTSTRAALQGKASRFAELGYDTVLVSEYGMCSETCLPWQGRVYIDDVFTDWDGEKDGDYGISKYCGKRFPLLSSAMRGGLFHPNCRHSISLWIEGHSKLPEPMDAEKIKERSKAEQKQRSLEREVRRHKREVVGLSDEAAVRLAKQKLKQAQAKLKAHIDEHDFLRRDYGREKIYDAPQSSAADQQLNTSETLPISNGKESQLKNRVDKYSSSDIIKSDAKSLEIPQEIIDDVTKAVEKVEEDFPIVSEQVEPIEFADTGDALGENGLRDDKAINVVKLSNRYCSDYSSLIDKLLADFESGFSYEADNVGSLVCHELGHAIHKILAFKRAGIRYGDVLTPILTNIFENNFIKITLDVYEAAFTDESYEEIQQICADDLGTMANSPSELIAQSFGNYYFGKSKSKIAKAIVEYFKKELKI